MEVIARISFGLPQSLEVIARISFGLPQSLEVIARVSFGLPQSLEVIARISFEIIAKSSRILRFWQLDWVCFVLHKTQPNTEGCLAQSKGRIYSFVSHSKNIAE